MIEKTKEIPVDVEGMYIEDGKLIYGNYHKINIGVKPAHGLKAKLIVEIPEEPISITRSEFVIKYNKIFGSVSNRADLVRLIDLMGFDY